MTLDESQDAFNAKPTHETAKAYALELLQYHADEMIGHDTFRAGLLDIVHVLTDGANDMGWPVATVTNAI